MAKQTSTSDNKGTFAQLYDVHEELSRRNTKPLGRPPKKVRRKPTTVHLTPSESRNLTKLQLQASEQFTVNRSELTGIAIDLLALPGGYRQGLAELQQHPRPRAPGTRRGMEGQGLRGTGGRAAGTGDGRGRPIGVLIYKAWP